MFIIFVFVDFHLVSKMAGNFNDKDFTSSQRNRFLEVMAAGLFENSDEMSDINVIVEGHSFPCHRLILATMSPYFKSMFMSGFRETNQKEIEIPEVSRIAFEQLKSFMYTGKCVITPANAMELLNGAAVFQLTGLQEDCERILADDIDTENCLDMFKFSRAYNCKILLEKCRPHVMEGFNGMWKSDEFETLELEDMESIVRDDDLVPLDEEQICEAVLKWINADLQTREKYLSRLFGHIRLASVRPEYLIDELYTNPLLIKNQDCVRYLDEIRNFLLLPARQHEFSSKRFRLRNSEDMEEVILVLTECDMERSGSLFQDGKSLWAYSHHQARWFTLAQVPFKENPGLQFSMVNFKNDLYLSGGTASSSKTLLKYDSERNEWGPSTTDSSMRKGRMNHMMVAVGQLVYVMGGHNPKQGKAVLGSVEEYNIVTRRWQTITELAEPIHGGKTAALGTNIYIFGGKREDGTWYEGIQVFNVRDREVRPLCKLLSSMKQPLNVVTVNGKIMLFTEVGDVFSFRPDKKDDSRKFKLIKKLHADQLPVLAVTHYRGDYILLSGSKSNPELFSKLWRLNLDSNPTRVDIVEPKEKVKPKFIHACLHGVINKQFMYHTYYQ